MKLELRWAMNEAHTEQYVRSVVLISESKDESALLDMAFGSRVIDGDGLIDRREVPVECRLSDGYGEHYINIVLAQPSTSAERSKP